MAKASAGGSALTSGLVCILAQWRGPNLILTPSGSHTRKPRRDWEFALSPERFISTYLEPSEGDPLSLPLIHRDLALHMGRSRLVESCPTSLADGGVPRRRPPAHGRSNRVDCRADQPVVM